MATYITLRTSFFPRFDGKPLGVLEGKQSGPILKGSLFCGEETLGQKDGSGDQ